MKSDLDKATVLKDKAAADFKANNLQQAIEKYYEIINIIRINASLKDSNEGKLLESQARLNIALCSFNLKDYDVAIDQCERVIDKDSSNGKAYFRLALSVYNKYN